MLEKSLHFRPLEALAAYADERSVNVLAGTGQRQAGANLELFLELVEVDYAVQFLVVQFVEDGALDLVGLEHDPVERR